MFRRKLTTTAQGVQNSCDNSTTTTTSDEDDDNETKKQTMKRRQYSARIVIICLALLPMFWRPRLSKASLLKQPPPSSSGTNTQQQQQLVATAKRAVGGTPLASAFKNHTKTTTTTNNTSDNVPKYHVVFSTGCSLSQDWQSYIFFYHAKKSGQPGMVTRIVSGCTPQQERTLQQQHQRFIQESMSQNFYIHFTPDYSKFGGVNYPYFNKPFGMRHWMEERLGYEKDNNNNNNPNDDTIVILLDPDQILLRPITHDYSHDLNIRWVKRRNANISKIVTPKSVIAQQYGYGSIWLQSVDLNHLLPNDIDTKSSPLWKLTAATAKRFAAGPPYLATARDMYAIVHPWAEFVPIVHKDRPSLLAEMFAFNLAAHHVHRRPLTTPSFMVSSPIEDETEGWYYVDQDGKQAVSPDFCSNQYPPPQSTLSSSTHHHPFVLHYCQHYEWQDLLFSKYLLPDNFLSCESDLLREPPRDWPMVNATTATTTPKRMILRSVYMLCTLIPAFNEAAENYKRQHCDNNKLASFEKRLVLVEPEMYKRAKKEHEDQLRGRATTAATT